MDNKGLVGFLDILGYQDIITNNKIDDVSRIISDLLLNLPDLILKKFVSFVEDEEHRLKFEKELKLIDSRLISDSILLVLPIDESLSTTEKAGKWINFVGYVALLLRTAFDNGLPLRGSVDYGDFFLKEHCFAGQPIINCYRLSHDLQFSGCSFTTEASKYFEKLFSSARDFDRRFFYQFVFPYLAPLNNRNAQRLFLIEWLCPTPDWDKRPDDIKQYIVEAFHAHNKDVPREVFPKIENTEMILRYINSMKKNKA